MAVPKLTVAKVQEARKAVNAAVVSALALAGLFVFLSPSLTQSILAVVAAVGNVAVVYASVNAAPGEPPASISYPTE